MRCSLARQPEPAGALRLSARCGRVLRWLSWWVSGPCWRWPARMNGCRCWRRVCPRSARLAFSHGSAGALTRPGAIQPMRKPAHGSRPIHISTPARSTHCAISRRATILSRWRSGRASANARQSVPRKSAPARHARGSTTTIRSGSASCWRSGWLLRSSGPAYKRPTAWRAPSFPIRGRCLAIPRWRSKRGSRLRTTRTPHLSR